jgi:sugar phosphate isomerase/epimerase
MVDTTDGLYKPEGMSDLEAMAGMKKSYALIMEAAERYGIVVNIETHGCFTANPDRMEEMLGFVDSSLLRMTFDTGNVYIAGEDPPAFLSRFLPRVSHVHIKDVTPELAAASRGKETGIGMSRGAIGAGVNAEGIKACMRMLRDADFAGAVSLECDAKGGPVMEESLLWFRGLLEELGYEHDLGPRSKDAPRGSGREGGAR